MGDAGPGSERSRSGVIRFLFGIDGDDRCGPGGCVCVPDPLRAIAPVARLVPAPRVASRAIIPATMTCRDPSGRVRFFGRRSGAGEPGSFRVWKGGGWGWGGGWERKGEGGRHSRDPARKVDFFSPRWPRFPFLESPPKKKRKEKMEK